MRLFHKSLMSSCPIDSTQGVAGHLLVLRTRFEDAHYDIGDYETASLCFFRIILLNFDMLRRLIISGLVLGAFFGCNAVEGENTGIFIRLRNNSDLTFQQVTVITGNREGFFNKIEPRQNSDYLEFEHAFRYATVFLEIDGKPLQLIPNDYTGETPLKDGFYTYRVGLSSANLSDASLTFEFVRD